MIEVYVLDDHPIVRKGLRYAVEREPSISITGEASNHGELVELLRKKAPDVLTLDIELPDCDGIDVLKEVTSAYPDVAVLMLSVYSEDHLAVRCIKSGAKGYLSKDRISEDIVTAILRVASGRRFITDSVAQRLALEIGGPPVDMPHEALSDREMQVFLMIAGGNKVNEIAEKLTISPSTVRTYRERIMSKMNMKNNSEIIYYAAKNELIE